jgi:preprotein translocase subunit YajC
MLAVLLAQNTQEAPNPFLALMPFLIILVLFYLLLIWPAQRREKRQREAILKALEKGQKVLTNAGLIGFVASIPNDDEVVLKLEEGKVRVLKSTIIKIYGAEEAAKESKPGAGKSSATPPETGK